MTLLENTMPHPACAPDCFQVLMFRLGEMHVCLDINAILRCFSLPALQALPGGAPYVAGIMNLAGCSVPVIDLALRLGLPSAPYTLNTPIVVCTDQTLNIGLIVSELLGIQNLYAKDLQLSTELSSPKQAFRATVHTGQGLALLLNARWLVETGLYQTEAPAEPLTP